MPFLILALIAAFLIWQVFLRPRRAATGCRWKKSPGQGERTLVRWQCMECAVEAYSGDGRPPKECKRGLRETQL